VADELLDPASGIIVDGRRFEAREGPAMGDVLVGKDLSEIIDERALRAAGRSALLLGAQETKAGVDQAALVRKDGFLFRTFVTLLPKCRERGVPDPLEKQGVEDAIDPAILPRRHGHPMLEAG